MEFFVPVLAFLGFVGGVALKHYIPEEVYAGGKYREIAEKLVLLVLALYLLSILEGSMVLYGLMGLGFVAGLLFRSSYVYLGMALLSLDFVVASLIFVYGLSYGDKSVVKYALLFFVPFLLLFTTLRLDFFLSLAVGACLAFVVTQGKH